MDNETMTDTVRRRVRNHGYETVCNGFVDRFAFRANQSETIYDNDSLLAVIELISLHGDAQFITRRARVMVWIMGETIPVDFTSKIQHRWGDRRKKSVKIDRLDFRDGTDRRTYPSNDTLPCEPFFFNQNY